MSVPRLNNNCADTSGQNKCLVSLTVIKLKNRQNSTSRQVHKHVVVRQSAEPNHRTQSFLHELQRNYLSK